MPTKLALFEHSVYWLVEAQTAARRQSLDTYGNVWECALSGPTAWRCDVLKVHPRSAPSTFTIMQEASQEIGINTFFTVSTKGFEPTAFPELM